MIHPIETAPERKSLLLWRADRRCWEIGKVERNLIANPAYAYTHWAELPAAPKPREVKRHLIRPDGGFYDLPDELQELSAEHL